MARRGGERCNEGEVATEDDGPCGFFQHDD